MTIKIGSIIRKLRTEQNVTQEQLANALGVTPQAVSRWESENGYPDIEYLPSLADFFKVSTDELLGYKLSERERELQEFKQEMDRLAEVGDLDEQLKFARYAVSKFPYDADLVQNLASCVFMKASDTNDMVLAKEAEVLYLKVLDICEDEELRNATIEALSWLYSDCFKDPEKALEIIKKLTPLKYNREYCLTYGIGDGKTEFYIQDYISSLTDHLGLAIVRYILSDDVSNDRSVWDKKIQMMYTAIEFYKVIFGENLMFYHNRVGRLYWLISTYQVEQGKIEETFDSLEKMCYHIIEYDKSYENDHGKNYDSIFTDKLTYPEPDGKNFHELKEHSQSYYILDYISHKRYDTIRNDNRFKNICAKLEEYSR